MIRSMVYVACNGCGNPAGGNESFADSAAEARAQAKCNGFERVRIEGKLQDLCARCAVGTPAGKVCSFPGCGKPVAYMQHTGDVIGSGWRHVDLADEVSSHVGYPMPREQAAPVTGSNPSTPAAGESRD